MEKKAFKKIIDICFDEDFQELHKEIVSIQVDIKRDKDYGRGIDEVLAAISIYSFDEFPEETMKEIEIIYEEYLDSLEM